MKRITITMPDETYQGVREAVDSGAAPNVSAFVAEATQAHLKESSMLDLLNELDANLGQPDEADVQWARRVLAQ